ncbi:MAG TPA: ankyrin repeat domain-containing protein [Gammaproteobacteria bacterium]|nr:ankyrin repeat domain-containing protein [Gammaproteobacteria bacterium]
MANEKNPTPQDSSTTLKRVGIFPTPVPLLHVACKQGDFPRVKLLVENIECRTPGLAFIDLKDDEGLVPLNVAVRHGRENIVKLLLQKKAKIHSNIHQHPPLEDACEYGHLAILKLLLAHGATLEGKDPDDITIHELFLTACENGHRDIVIFLAEKGANTLVPQAVIAAIELNDSRIARFLLREALKKGDGIPEYWEELAEYYEDYLVPLCVKAPALLLDCAKRTGQPEKEIQKLNMILGSAAEPPTKKHAP